MPRVFDCLVLEDPDSMEARFGALKDIPEVTHVICEGPLDKDGNPKPLHFWENKDQRTRWHGRWTSVRVTKEEMRQLPLREWVLHGLSGDDDDIVIYSDSIPDPDMVRECAREGSIPGMMRVKDARDSARTALG
jgi:hypothetical protein